MDENIVSEYEEKIKILTEQLEEQKKSRTYINSVFSKLNYFIGELRGKIISQEKTIRKLESRAVRSEELVKQIDPLTLAEKFEKEKSHIETVGAKIDSFIEVANSVKQEIVNVNNKVSALGTSKDLEQMNKSIQSNLTYVLKLYSKMSGELEKSISFFNEMQKNYTSSLKVFGKLESIDNSLSSIRKDQNDLRVSLHNYVARDVYNSKISEIKKYLDFVNKKYEEVILSSGLDKNKLENSTVVSDNLKNIEATQEVDKLLEDAKPKNKDDNKKDDDLVFMRSY